MPSNTAGGFPYPLPAEPVRDGANAIKNLATETDKRLSNLSVFGVYAVGLFDGNGLWYQSWSGWGITWADIPNVTVTPLTFGTPSSSSDTGILFSIYQPHNSATTLVLGASYIKDGRGFSGNIGMLINAIGRKA